MSEIPTAKGSRFLYSQAFAAFPFPDSCPFRPERAALTYDICESMGWFDAVHRADDNFNAASAAELARFHTPQYLRILQNATAQNLGEAELAVGLGTPDTPLFPSVYDYSRWAAGASLAGADLLLCSEAQLVFNLWGGFHHADPSSAAGFCYVNDAALACHRLADAGRRVFYLDIDAHHGDGVQRAFYQRGDVFTLSMHESGLTLFPGTGFEDETGQGDGFGACLNIPLPAYCYDEAFLHIFRALVPSTIGQFSPDVIVIEAGMDTLAGDPLTHLALTNGAVATACKEVQDLGIPLLVLGGGGYHVRNTVRAWSLLWAVLTGNDDPFDLAAGMGGVMLESTDWAGGLRDRAHPPSRQDRVSVDHEIVRLLRALLPQIPGG